MPYVSDNQAVFDENVAKLQNGHMVRATDGPFIYNIKKDRDAFVATRTINTDNGTPVKWTYPTATAALYYMQSVVPAPPVVDPTQTPRNLTICL